MNEWISAAIAVGAGFVVGAIAARIVRNLLLKAPREAIRSAAAPLASLVFSTAFIIGLVVALGIVNPDSLDTIPADLVEFLPRALAAAIVVIGGNVVGTLARTATQQALRGAGPIERFGPSAVRIAVLAFALILGAAQLGIDTTIINIAAAALLFGGAATMALLVGLGGRRVAGEIAAGRAWRNALEVGDRVRASGLAGGEVDGIVVEIRPTSVELDCAGRSLLVPNSQLLDVVVERIRSE
ncbi:MAG: mechanosensitive ion channel [Ilumatobacter sp.]|uniref:mechanosensitive ion channel family protein n=1 Tax=Ilumatobacter sp. TaxID=1967498 RepID=UPI002612E2DF|nr:mechanosensitive ion channel domain-containing protein [Ilumatobacter sp.]MDJ0768609.1 mechanosensitive ion channel [Ilumatobacter sp.]